MEIFVVHKLTSACIIGLYVHNSFSLHIGFLETVSINNQKILRFVHFCSKGVPVNISYPIIVDPIDGYLDTWIISSQLIYIITNYKPMNYKSNMRKRS